MLNCISTEAIKNQMMAYTDAEGSFLCSDVPCVCAMHVDMDGDWSLTMYHYFGDTVVCMLAYAVSDTEVGVDIHYTNDNKIEDFDYVEIDMSTTDRQLLGMLKNMFAYYANTIMAIVNDDMTD